MSKKFREWSINQEYLFPPSVKDFVPEGHVAHFVRDMVAGELDLRAIVNDYVEERGLPPYHPAMMTAVLLYAYTQGVYSSRKIARACEERVDFKAVSGMSTPDFRTIAKFRTRHIEALGELFGQVLQMCQAAGLVKLGHVGLDGTKLSANASLDKSKTYKSIKEEERKIRREIKEWLIKGQEADEQEDNEYGVDKRGDELPGWVKNKEERRKRLSEARKKLEIEAKEEKEKRAQAEQEGKKPRAATKKTNGPKPTSRYSFTDPDSKCQKGRRGFSQGYNAQIAVDSEAQIIVAHGVVNAANDIDQLEPMLDKIKKNLGQDPDELSADHGYCCESNLRVLEERGIRGYVAVGQNPAVRKRTMLKGSLMEKMALRLKRGGHRTRYRLRKTLPEPVFGIIKAARGFRQFLLRNLNKVTHEFSLVCTAHNLLKLAALRA